MGITFRYNESTLNRDLGRMSEKVGATVLHYAKTKAAVIEGWMKKNRPWTDQTTRAKAGLFVSVSQPAENKIRMTLAHGVKYGKWLEGRWDGGIEMIEEKKWAIINPALRKFSPEVVEELQGIMEKMV